jgi:hypothetical protein
MSGPLPSELGRLTAMSFLLCGTYYQCNERDWCTIWGTYWEEWDHVGYPFCITFSHAYALFCVAGQQQHTGNNTLLTGVLPTELKLLSNLMEVYLGTYTTL